MSETGKVPTSPPQPPALKKTNPVPKSVQPGCLFVSKSKSHAKKLSQEQLKLPEYTGSGKFIPGKALHILGEEELAQTSQKVVPGDPDARSVKPKAIFVLGGDEKLMPDKAFQRMGTGTNAQFAKIASSKKLAEEKKTQKQNELKKLLQKREPSDEQLEIPEASKGRHVPVKALDFFGDETLDMHSRKIVDSPSSTTSSNSSVSYKALTKLGIEKDSELIPEKARSRLGSFSYDARVKADEFLLKERERYLADIGKKRGSGDLGVRLHSSSLERFKSAAQQVLSKAKKSIIK